MPCTLRSIEWHATQSSYSFSPSARSPPACAMPAAPTSIAGIHAIARIAKPLMPAPVAWETKLHPHVTAVDPSQLLQSLLQGCDATLPLGVVLGEDGEHADPARLVRLLRARRERPSCRCTAEQCDELAPPHGAYPKARDHGLSIAGQARASQQSRAAHVRSG